MIPEVTAGLAPERTAKLATENPARETVRAEVAVVHAVSAGRDGTATNPGAREEAPAKVRDPVTDPACEIVMSTATQLRERATAVNVADVPVVPMRIGRKEPLAGKDPIADPEMLNRVAATTQPEANAAKGPAGVHALRGIRHQTTRIRRNGQNVVNGLNEENAPREGNVPNTTNGLSAATVPSAANGLSDGSNR